MTYEKMLTVLDSGYIHGPRGHEIKNTMGGGMVNLRGITLAEKYNRSYPGNMMLTTDCHRAPCNELLIFIEKMMLEKVAGTTQMNQKIHFLVFLNFIPEVKCSPCFIPIVLSKPNVQDGKNFSHSNILNLSPVLHRD